mgnify:CR=1 FL=1
MIVPMSEAKNSVCFIGMSGIGKSYFGKLVAERLGVPFIDTDDLIEQRITTSLKEFLSDKGEEAFKALEEDCILRINFNQRKVVATGGSVVYSETSMAYLKKHCKLLFLNDSLQNIQSRIENYSNRAIIMNGESTFDAVYTQRLDLYKKYADKHIDYPSPFSINAILDSILKQLT